MSEIRIFWAAAGMFHRACTALDAEQELIVPPQHAAGNAAPLTLAPTPQAPAQARRYAQEFCTTSSHVEACDVAKLVVSELVVNAVRHAGTPLTLQMEDMTDGLCVSVADSSGARPQPRVAEPFDEGGRGLMLVEMLSRRWGVEMTDEGKLVWAEIPDGDQLAEGPDDPGARPAGQR